MLAGVEADAEGIEEGCHRPLIPRFDDDQGSIVAVEINEGKPFVCSSLVMDKHKATQHEVLTDVLRLALGSTF